MSIETLLEKSKQKTLFPHTNNKIAMKIVYNKTLSSFKRFYQRISYFAENITKN